MEKQRIKITDFLFLVTPQTRLKKHLVGKMKHLVRPDILFLVTPQTMLKKHLVKKTKHLVRPDILFLVTPQTMFEPFFDLKHFLNTLYNF